MRLRQEADSLRVANHGRPFLYARGCEHPRVAEPPLRNGEGPSFPHREGLDIDIWTRRGNHPGIASGNEAGEKGTGHDYLDEFRDVVQIVVPGAVVEYHPIKDLNRNPPRHPNHIHMTGRVSPLSAAV
jgi:hypothetical protein